MDAVNGNAAASIPQRSPEPLGWDGIGSVFILLIASVSLNNWLPDASPPALLLRVLWVFFYLAAVATLTLRFGTEWLAWTIRRQPALCILLILAAASYLWSVAPLISLQKAVSLAGTTGLGVFIGYACPPRRIMHILGWVFGLVIVSSILAVAVLPKPESIALGWRGIMSQKNSLGATAAMATVFFLVATLRASITPAWKGAVLCVVSIVALVGARSRISWAALVISLAVLTVLSRRRITAWKRLSLGLVLCVSVLPFFVGPFAAALGNNDPLNGRTHLWSGVARIMRERPMTGYGYAVVWGRGSATLVHRIRETSDQSAVTAHNSILDIVSELGIPAAIVACFYLFAALVNAGRLFEREPSAFSLFALLFVANITFMGFGEAHLLRIHSPFWILLVALTVAVKRSLERLESATTSTGAPA